MTLYTACVKRERVPACGLKARKRNVFLVSPRSGPFGQCIFILAARTSKAKCEHLKARQMREMKIYDLSRSLVFVRVSFNFASLSSFTISDDNLVTRAGDTPRVCFSILGRWGQK